MYDTPALRGFWVTKAQGSAADCEVGSTCAQAWWQDASEALSAVRRKEPGCFKRFPLGCPWSDSHPPNNNNKKKNWHFGSKREFLPRQLELSLGLAIVLFMFEACKRRSSLPKYQGWDVLNLTKNVFPAGCVRKKHLKKHIHSPEKQKG